MRHHSRRAKRRAAQVAIESLEHRAMLTTFVGTSSARFENAVGGVSSGVGTSTFNWGGVSTGDVNEFRVETNAIDVEQETLFSLGSLTYFNGITAGGSDSTAVDLVVRAELTSPELDNPIVVERTLNMMATPNTGTDDENADTVVLGGETHANFEVGETTYAFQILGFGNLVDGEFEAMTEVVLREQDTTTLEMIAEFIPLSDLKVSRLNTDEASFVGNETEYSFTVANRGDGAVRDGFTAALVLSTCLLYTSPSPRDATLSRMPSSA